MWRIGGDEPCRRKKIGLLMDGSERRRHPRVPVHGKVSGKIHAFAEAEVINLSRSGALLQVPNSPAIGALYPLRLSFSNLEPLELKAKVVRCEAYENRRNGEGESTMVFRVGVIFTELTKSQEQVINEITTKVGEASVQAHLSMEALDNDLVDVPNAPFTTPALSHPPAPSPKRIKRQAPRAITAGQLQSQIFFRLDAEVLQISPIGMAVKVPTPLPKGATRTFTIAVENQTLDLVGKVANCTKLQSGESPSYKVGVEFVGLDEQTQQLLTSYVHSKLDKKTKSRLESRLETQSKLKQPSS